MNGLEFFFILSDRCIELQYFTIDINLKANNITRHVRISIGR
jgi:hypothetical protein